MNTTITTTATVPATTNPSTSLVRNMLIGGAVALAGNTLLFALGSIGEPIEVVIGADSAPKAVTLFEVAATTIVAVVIGALALRVTRWRGLTDRTWMIGAAVVAAASAVPLWGLEIDSASKLFLTAMHLLTGVCCIAAQRPRS